MIKIYKTILSLYKEKFLNSSKEFQKGFQACLYLFKVGIEKSTSFNLQLRVEELSRRNKKLSKENTKLREEIDKYKENLNQKELFSLHPSQFKEYVLETPYGDFRVVINASKETLMVLWYSFVRATKFSSINECKSKFLAMITGLKSKGFIAYKDLKTAKKETLYDNQFRES